MNCINLNTRILEPFYKIIANNMFLLLEPACLIVHPFLDKCSYNALIKNLPLLEQYQQLQSYTQNKINNQQRYHLWLKPLTKFINLPKKSLWLDLLNELTDIQFSSTILKILNASSNLNLFHDNMSNYMTIRLVKERFC